jgi:hypothetical protein
VIVHLVNYSGCQKDHCEMPLPVQDVTLYGTGSPSRVRALKAEEDLDMHRGAGGWSAVVREIRLFEALVIEEML